ncbi:MAG: hypothetical protein ABIO16_07280 [Nocardioides sp.]
MTEAPDEYPDSSSDDDGGAVADAGVEGRADEPAAEEAVRTGDPRVDEVLGSMDALHELPVGEHAAVFEAAHDQLRSALEPDRGSS